MYSGVWTRALRSHAVAQFGWTGTDELSQCNTGSVPLPPGEYGPLSGCGLKNSTHNTCSILLESPGKKKNPLVITWPVQIFARSYEIFKYCNNLLGSACFLSKLRKWTDEAAGYYNPTPENTYRPFVTKDIDSIFFFLIRTVSTTHPPLFHYPLFLCDSFKIFYTCTFKFPPFVFFLFLTNLIYLITGNKKRKKYVVSLLHCGGVRYRVMIRRSSASPYV